MENLQKSIKENINKVNFLRDRVDALKKEQQRVERMAASARETQESPEVVGSLMGQYGQLKMDEHRFSGELEETRDLVDNLGRQLDDLKKSS